MYHDRQPEPECRSPIVVTEQYAYTYNIVM